MPPQAKDHATENNTMRRVDSESDMSVASEASGRGYRDYRVRKSNLIG